jgi:hypothetical protein
VSQQAPVNPLIFTEIKYFNVWFDHNLCILLMDILGFLIRFHS